MHLRVVRAPVLALIVGLLAAAALLLAPAARADPPSALSSQVTDSARVLDDSAASSAVAKLSSATTVKLYVVFVKSFDGLSGQAWAEQTARASGFGDGQILLAVATGDRKYGYDGTGGGLDGSDVGAIVDQDVKPHLADSDWDGAVSAAADGLQRAVQARTSGGSGSSGSGSSGGTSSGSSDGSALAVGLVTLVVLIGLAALVIALVVRARRRARTRTTPAGQVADPTGTARLPTVELARQADAALVRTDDTVASSAQELTFARAEFGDEATAPFAASLATAQRELSTAFAARRRLDDAASAGALDEPARRALLTEVLRATSAANAAIEDQAGAFAQLRDVERRLPAVLDDLTARQQALTARAPQEQWNLDRLALTWSPAALRPVRGNVEQATRLLTVAQGQIDDARTKAAAGATGEAAVVAHAVEGALAQATTLLDAIGARGQDLTEAAAGLEDALRETDADLAQARGLIDAGHRDPALSGLVARATEAREAAAGAAAPTGGVDPIAALRSLAGADAALDQALDAVREQGQQATRASSALAAALPAARAEVAAARSYLTTRRGAVGTEPRATLASAEELLDAAERTAASDPVSALASAQRADALAERARAQADDDVDRWDDQVGGRGGRGGFGGPGGWGPGGWGGQGWGGRGWGGGGYGGGAGGSFGGAVLGGVLGGILSGGGGGGGGGGWSGGGGGGDFGGGDFGGGGGGSDSGGGSF